MTRNRVRVQLLNFSSKHADPAVFGIGTKRFLLSRTKDFMAAASTTEALFFCSTGVCTSPHPRTSTYYMPNNHWQSGDILEIAISDRIVFSLNNSVVSNRHLRKRTLPKDASLSDLLPVFKLPHLTSLHFLPLDDDAASGGGGGA